MKGGNLKSPINGALIAAAVSSPGVSAWPGEKPYDEKEGLLLRRRGQLLQHLRKFCVHVLSHSVPEQFLQPGEVISRKRTVGCSGADSGKLGVSGFEFWRLVL